MLFDADRNRSGFESKKKKICSSHAARSLLTPFCVLLVTGSFLFVVSSHVLTGDFVEQGRGQNRLVTRSLHESNIESNDESSAESNQTVLDLNSTTTTVILKSETTTTTTSASTTPSEVETQSTCKGPKNNIFFLKTHKAGSTTVQNVLLRYGEKNNATFALPKQSAAHVFNYNVKFSNSMVRPSPTGEYNILCNHLHFYEPGVRQVMPPDTKFVAIVRHPIDLFESIMSYYVDDVRAFQRVPDELCWNTEDISYLKSNSRKRSQESVRAWLGEEYVDKLLEWNKADWKLYRHFNETFTRKVEEFGVGRMKREVAKLQEANENIRDECLSGDQTTTFFRTVPLTKYRLKDKNDEFCQNLIRSERQYLYKINTKQEEMMKRQLPGQLL